MNKKSVALSMTAPEPKKAEQWVANATPVTGVPTTRLSIELPSDLHARVKADCALKQRKMVDVFRELIEREFAHLVAGK